MDADSALGRCPGEESGEEKAIEMLRTIVLEGGVVGVGEGEDLGRKVARTLALRELVVRVRVGGGELASCSDCFMVSTEGRGIGSWKGKLEREGGELETGEEL